MISCRVVRLLFLLNLTWPSVQPSNSFLSDAAVKIQNVLAYNPTKHSACQKTPTGPIETTTCDYESVESVNNDLFKNLRDLVRLPFFKYFQVDLYRECPFWQENGSCMNINCAITTVNESDVPEKWRAATLSKIELPPIDQRNQLPGCYYRDADFCFLDDMTEGEYFDLSLVPEQFTGYSGPSTHRVWKSIYEENCFGLSEINLMIEKSPAPVIIPHTTDFLHEDIENNGYCLEKRVYYKIISGLHASISTHICHDYLNQTTGEWGPNLHCFITRIASRPERLRHIYFNTVLLLRAVARLGPYLSAYDYCSTGTHEDDAETMAKLLKVIAIAQNVGKFDETVLFRGENANVLKEEFKAHFRNISRIMDCVGCDKCRLWGKVQTTGIGTALKILFELDEKTLDPHSNLNLLQRSEVVALINTIYRFSESLEMVNVFRQLWAKTSPAESAKFILEAENLVAGWPHPPSSTGAEQPQKIQEYIRMCWAFCIGILLEVRDESIRLLASLFRTSGKEHGPTGASSGDL